MGFSSLATYVILFAVGMSLIVGFILTYKDYFVRSSYSLEVKQAITSEKSDSSIEIINYTYNETKINLPAIIYTSETDFATGIFDNISETETPGSLTLHPDAVGYNDGTWYSRIIELNYSINYTTIDIAGFVTQPTQENVSVQLRSANNSAELTGEFLGPDGTTSTSYKLGTSTINNIHTGDSVLQIKVYMHRDSWFIEPRLDSITIGNQAINILNLTIQNKGKLRLKPELMDFFIDTERISRNQIYSRKLIESTDILNPNLWDPEEMITVLISSQFEKGTHIISAFNEFSSKDTHSMII